jgi:hypothetical protein
VWSLSASFFDLDDGRAHSFAETVDVFEHAKRFCVGGNRDLPSELLVATRAHYPQVCRRGVTAAEASEVSIATEFWPYFRRPSLCEACLPTLHIVYPFPPSSHETELRWERWIRDRNAPRVASL